MKKYIIIALCVFLVLAFWYIISNSTATEDSKLAELDNVAFKDGYKPSERGYNEISRGVLDYHFLQYAEHQSTNMYQYTFGGWIQAGDLIKAAKDGVFNNGVQFFYCRNMNDFFLAFRGTDGLSNEIKGDHFVSIYNIDLMSVTMNLPGPHLPSDLLVEILDNDPAPHVNFANPIATNENAIRQYVSNFNLLGGKNKHIGGYYRRHDIVDFVEYYEEDIKGEDENPDVRNLSDYVLYLFGYDETEGANELRLMLIPMDNNNHPLAEQNVSYFLERTWP